MRRIKEYFKNTDRSRIYEDFYAIMFVLAGIASMIYIAVKLARLKA